MTLSGAQITGVRPLGTPLFQVPLRLRNPFTVFKESKNPHLSSSESLCLLLGEMPSAWASVSPSMKCPTQALGLP